MYVDLKEAALLRDLSRFTYVDDLLFCLDECQCDRADLSVLVLDRDLAGPGVRIRIRIETELELATGKCPDGNEMDPRLGCRFYFDNHVRVVLDIHGEGSSLRRDLHSITYCDDFLFCLDEGQGDVGHLT